MALLVATLLVGACDKSTVESDRAQATGRYAGIGVFDPGRLWREMKAAAAADPAAATLADDEHIIVVIDSHTGEVRQCGDHSGYCIRMNPWSGGAASSPISLSRHLAAIEAGPAKAK